MKGINKDVKAAWITSGASLITRESISILLAESACVQMLYPSR